MVGKSRFYNDKDKYNKLFLLPINTTILQIYSIYIPTLMTKIRFTLENNNRRKLDILKNTKKL